MNRTSDALLRSSTVDLPQAMEDLAAPAYVIDREGRFRWVNDAYVKLLGDRRGKPFADSVAPEHRQLARTNFARKVSGKPTNVFDLRVLDRNGAHVTLRITSAPLRRGDEVVGVFGIAVPLERPAQRSRSVLDDLTPRQAEALRLLSEGLETQEIANRLGVAEETARNHIRALLRATGARSRLQAVVMGLREGVLTPHLTQPGQHAAPAAADD